MWDVAQASDGSGAGTPADRDTGPGPAGLGLLGLEERDEVSVRMRGCFARHGLPLRRSMCIVGRQP